jgi:hypothetical protein
MELTDIKSLIDDVNSRDYVNVDNLITSAASEATLLTFLVP